MISRNDLKSPYWALPDDKGPWPGLDFNREIVTPGTNDTFPDGALGIRVDDDFWAVAALPLSWKDQPLADIVASLWPSRAPRAEYGPDVVS